VHQLIKCNDDFIFKIFEWYKSAMISVGCFAKFPKNTNPAKTYTFRALSKFANKMVELDLDDNMIKFFIKTIVRYAKRNKLLNKGAYLLTMNSILEICYDELIKNDFNHGGLESSLRNDKNFVSSLGVDRNEIFNKLVEPISYGHIPGIIYYYNLDKIALPFLSLSKICNLVLQNLCEKDRSELPSQITILKTRVKLLSNHDHIINDILKNDLTTRGVF